LSKVVRLRRGGNWNRAFVLPVGSSGENRNWGTAAGGGATHTEKFVRKLEGAKRTFEDNFFWDVYRGWLDGFTNAQIKARFSYQARWNVQWTKLNVASRCSSFYYFDGGERCFICCIVLQGRFGLRTSRSIPSFHNNVFYRLTILVILWEMLFRKMRHR
jgi:hypothetical protein